MKKCFKCKQEKPLSEFYKHPKMSDGYLNKCKTCAKQDARENYNQKARDIQFVLSERERSREKSRRLGYPDKYHSNIEQKRTVIQRYFENHPEKKIAKNIVSNAIRDGRLIKQPCAICNITENIQAHHEDYSKPLEVTWLCIKHHNERHVELRREKLLQQFVQ